MNSNESERGPGRPPIDNPADHQIQLRVTAERKSAYVKAAQKSPQRKLSAWMFHHLDAASGYTPPAADES